ncbi:MAG: tryptophan--tRNA ligase, partial [Ottowia sp.]
FKQYREADGRFYFKLTDAAGRTLLQSRAFDSPREAGQAVKRLQAEGAAALPALAPQLDLAASQPTDHVASALAQLLQAVAV